MKKNASAPRRSAVLKKRILPIAVTVLMCVVCLFSLFMYIRSFLPVTRFELLGVTQYDSAELVAAAGVKAGDKLYSIDVGEIEKTLLEKFYYIDEVYVDRKFPNKLVFNIIEKIPGWYIAVSGNYYTLDSDFLVIEETVSNEKFVNLGIPQLILPSLRSAICGELPEFGEDENEIKRSLEIVSAINASTLKYRITLVDMEKRFDIKIVVDGKYHVEIGSMDNIEEKLRAMEAVLKSGKLEQYAGANIYLSDPSKPSVKPLYE